MWSPPDGYAAWTAVIWVDTDGQAFVRFTNALGRLNFTNKNLRDMYAICAVAGLGSTAPVPNAKYPRAVLTSQTNSSNCVGVDQWTGGHHIEDTDLWCI